MDSKKIISIINILIDVLYLGILFFVPLFFAYFLRTNNIFELNKAVLFKILLVLLLFFSLVKLFLFSDKPCCKNISSMFKGKKDLLVWFLPILTISMFFGVFFSIDPELSLSGSYTRQQGFFLYLYLVLFFVLLLFNIRTKKQLNNAFVAITLSAFLVSIYALLQAWGKDPLLWSESTALRATSTLGQPNNLGSFFLATLPLAFYLALSSRAIVWRALACLSLFSQLIALYFSFSTSAWLGAIAASAFIALILLTEHKRMHALKRFFLRRKRILIGALLALVLMVSALGLYGSTTFKNKIANLADVQTGSTAARLQFWQASWQAIGERPWLGYGLDTQEDVLAGYYQPDWALWSNINVVPGRAHNIFLDTLLTRGILGLLVVLVLLSGIAYSLWRSFKHQTDRPLVYVMIFFFVAYFIYLQFNFHHLTSLVYLAFYLAVLVVAGRLEKTSKREKFRFALSHVFPKRKILAASLTLLMVLGAGVFVFFSVNAQLRTLESDHYLYELRVARQNKNYFFAFDLYDFLQEDGAHSAYYEQQFGYIIAEWANKFYSKFYDMGMEKVKEILPKIDKNTFSHTLARARLYTVLGRQDARNYEKARNDYESLLAMSPDMPLVYSQYAEMNKAEQDKTSAIRNFELSLDRLPQADDPRLNYEHRLKLKAETSRLEDEIRNLRIKDVSQ